MLFNDLRRFYKIPICVKYKYFPRIKKGQEQTKEHRNARQYLSTRFGWRCWYCGVKLVPGSGHLDHVIPISRNGPDIKSNWALACNFCNYAKHDHPLDDFMSWLEWVRGGKSFTPYNMDETAVKDAIRAELNDNNWEPAVLKEKS